VITHVFLIVIFVFFVIVIISISTLVQQWWIGIVQDLLGEGAYFS
jgi:hypothetical protein